MSSPVVYDVLIIGAGAAGLSCASHILSFSTDTDNTADSSAKEEAPSILVLESLDYVGGRVRTSTLQSSGVKVDAGAEFIHGSTTLLNALVKENNFETTDVFTAAQGDGGPDDEPTPSGHYGVYYLADSAEKLLLRYDSTDPDFTSLNSSFHSLSSLSLTAVPLHLSVADHCTVPPRLASLADAGYANTCCCSSISDISLRRTVEYEKHWELKDGCSTADGGDVRLGGGAHMSDLMNVIAEPVRRHIRLSTHVKSVTYSSDVCLISCAGLPQPIKARKVVVTVPIKILQEGDIAFDPPLPKAKVEAMGLYGMEDAAKLVLVFRTAVWPEKVR